MGRPTFLIVFILLLGLVAGCVESSDDDADDSGDDSVAAESSPTAEATEDEPSPEPTEEEPTPEPTATEEMAETPEATEEPEPTETATDEPDETATAEPDDDNGDGEGEEHVISIQDNEFDPDEIEIAPGDTVTWINDGGLMHTSTLDPEIARDPENAVLPDGAETWDSGDMESGDEFSITLEVPGEYTYFCRPHEALGMTGTIIVTDSDEETGDSNGSGDDDNDEDEDEADDYL
jgi:plastocyanin